MNGIQLLQATQFARRNALLLFILFWTVTIAKFIRNFIDEVTSHKQFGF
jgi:hypothetical protein